MIRCLIALGVAILLSACANPAPQADIVIGAQGCDQMKVTLTADRTPELLVHNTANEPMVVSLPNWNNSLTLAAGARGMLAIEPYAWGDVEYYCLTEKNHTAAGGGPMPAGFVCGIDAYAIRPLSLSSGVLHVEKNNRLRTVAGIAVATSVFFPHP